MPSSYGPSSSIYGPNRALDAYARRLEQGDVKVTRASAEEVMALVGEDGKVTVEEASTLEKVWETALDAKDPAEGHTRFGRELLMSYASAARNRLFAYQVNSTYTPASAWMSMMSFGFWSAPKPSYVGIDQSARPGEGRATPVDEEARERAIDRLAGPAAFQRLLDEYPAAVADVGSTYRAPTPEADVLAKYDELVAQMRAGAVDEDDPLGELRQYLEANYG